MNNPTSLLNIRHPFWNNSDKNKWQDDIILHSNKRKIIKSFFKDLKKLNETIDFIIMYRHNFYNFIAPADLARPVIAPADLSGPLIPVHDSHLPQDYLLDVREVEIPPEIRVRMQRARDEGLQEMNVY